MTPTNGSVPLVGRVALVTGGGRGIGRSTSLRLAALGAAVAVNWRRDEDAARTTVEQIRASGGQAAGYQGAVDSPADCAALVGSVESDLGPIGILVHNGGVASSGRPVIETDVAEVERLLRVHAIGPHELTRLVLPGMRTQARGDVVMISSVVTHTLGAGGAPYSMGKAALEALAFTLAKEEAAYGIHVNVVAPGLVASDMGDRLVKSVTAGAVGSAAGLDAESPFGHVCRPAEVADLVAFLVSPEAGYLTGQRIVIDGGAHPHRA